MRSWRAQQEGSSKDELGIKHRATEKTAKMLPFRMATFLRLALLGSVRKNAKIHPRFLEKGENANKTLTFLCYNKAYE